MIKVTLYPGSAGFLMTGHAGFSQSGTDIVCAAASILSTTCANALETVAHVVPDVVVRDGYLKVLLPKEMSSGQAHDAAVILQTFKQGICDLCEAYSDYITLRIGGTSP